MLQYTGERVIPELMKPTNGLLLEHIARYYFSYPYAKGRMLDIACGVGYGTSMVTKANKKDLSEVIGVDIDESTIQYAKGKYYHPLISYQQGDAVDSDLPSKLGQFDTILSFETLEHIAAETQFLLNLYQMLKPGGTLVISTPFGRGRGKPTNEPFHVHQLTINEFKGLFHNYTDVSFFGQRGVLFQPLDTSHYFSLGIAVCRK